MSQTSALHLALFFTKGMSLKQWDKLGILERELDLYRALLPELGAVTFVTYGGEDELAYRDVLQGIRVLYNPGMPGDEYARNMLDVHSTSLAEATVYQSNQIAGSSLVVEAAKRFGGTSLVRCGYFASEFVGNASGHGSPEHEAAISEEQFALTEADHVILTTDAALRFAVAAYGVDPNTITLIPNYVRTDLFVPDPTVDKVPGRILFPGRLSPQKNPLALVRALKGTGSELLFASDGELRDEVEALAFELDVNARVLGFSPYAELPGLLNSAELVVLPSHYEGGPPKMVMESMACGCAVVLARTTGNDQLLVPGHNAVECTTEVGSIREAILGLLGNDALQRRLGENGREYIVRLHGLEAVKEKFIALYAHLSGDWREFPAH